MLSASKQPLAKIDNYAPFTLKNSKFNVTVRSTFCSILVTNGRCSFSTRVRPTIRGQFRRWKERQQHTPTHHASASSHTNLRYLSSPLARQRFVNVRKRLVSAEHKQAMWVLLWYE